jgi:hypothetical protein
MNEVVFIMALAAGLVLLLVLVFLTARPREPKDGL